MKPKILACLVGLVCVASWAFGQGKDEEPEPAEAFLLEELVEKARKEGRGYLAFLDRPSLSAGVYRLPVEGVDKQSPHDLDEVYYVVSGKARLAAGDEEFEARAGSILFVQAKIEHHFFDIEEDLVVVVFFSKKREEEQAR